MHSFWKYKKSVKITQYYISGGFLLFKYSFEDFFFKKIVSFTDHSPLRNQAPSKQYTKNQSTSHNTAFSLSSHNFTGKAQDSFLYRNLVSYHAVLTHQSKAKKYATHLEATNVVKYTTGQVNLKLGQWLTFWTGLGS